MSKKMMTKGFALFSLFNGMVANASFTFTPISANLSTTGKERALVAQVVNTGKEKIPVLIHIFKRTLSEDGKEVRNPTEDLSVFPSQFTLAPKERKNVQIVWRGAADLDFEQAYRCLVEELPIDFSPRAQNAGNIRILLNYDAALYVNSRPGAADLKLTSVEPVEQGKRLKLTLANIGDAHAVTTKPEIGLKCADQESSGASKEDFYFLKGDALKSFSGKNFLARSQLVAKVAIPPKLQKCTRFAWVFSGEK